MPASGGNGGFPFTNRPTNFTGYLTYPTASLDPSSSTLTVREKETDERQMLPQSSFTFDDANNVTVTKAAAFAEAATAERLYPATPPTVHTHAFSPTRNPH